MTCGSNDQKKRPWFNKVLMTLALSEMRVYTHRVNKMAEGSTDVTRVVCADKQNDIPGGDHDF